MSDKPVLILMHGIGMHTSDSFKEDVVESVNNALERYPSYKKLKIENELIIHSISYDHLFEKIRKEISSSSKTVEHFIKTQLAGVDTPDLMNKLIGIDANLGSDTFENTHALDVILYLSIFGESVRGFVIKELVSIFGQHGAGTTYHFLTHSLGTSVMHDSLNKLFPDEKPLGQPQISTYWSFANVSDLVTWASGLTSPYQSIVKPGVGGIMNEFYNIYHECDPIAFDLFRRFDPKNNGSWISKSAFDNAYRKIVTKEFSRKNTHSIKGYIEDPKVSYPLLYAFLDDFDPNSTEQAQANKAFKHYQGELNKIKHYQQTGGFTADIKGLVAAITGFIRYFKEDKQ
jgi:hypothetical protein